MKFPLIIALLVLMVSPASGATSGQIIGIHSVQLSSPMTPDISSKTKTEAQDQFKKDLLGWLHEDLNAGWDTANGVDKLHFNAFSRSCIAKAKEDTRFDGPKWTVSYMMPTDDIPGRIVEWNSLLDTLALRSYHELLKAASARPRSTEAVYGCGVQTIFYAKGRLGGPLKVPERPTVEVLADARAILDSAIGGLTISSNEMVVQGKPGTMAQKGLTLIVKVDTVPLMGVALRATLPSGKCLIAGTTDGAGRLSLDRLRIPYVANGTFLAIRLNPGVQIDTNSVFTVEDLGLAKCKSAEHALIFKLQKPLFGLTYRAAAVNNLEIPKDFSENATLERFLHDSLRFEPVPAGGRPDLAIDVVCQVSSYNHDKTEETVVKTEIQVSIREMTGSDPHSITQNAVFEKSYENGPPLPVGLYFWEASGVLRKMIRSVLESL